MKVPFTYQGKSYTLHKHNDVMRALAEKTMTEIEAKSKPWYLRARVGGKRVKFTIGASAPKDAEREAKLKLSELPTDTYKAFVAEQEKMKSISIGALAEQWSKAGYAWHELKPREDEAATRMKETLARAMNWWQLMPVAVINHATHKEYAAHRSPAYRSADLELAALSSMCQWAVLLGKIERNPFEKRVRFATVKTHCHEACPATDEILHQILAYLFDSHVSDAHHPNGVRNHQLCGGRLAWCALTGLRPGEPAALLKLPPLAETPRDTKILQPGTIFPDATGQLRMKVERLKRGQNPFVKIHPAAEQFLSAWRAYLARTMPNTKLLFPLGTSDETPLNRALNAACTKLELPKMKPHGMRAFYVKVRRSHDVDDSAISGELGQSTNAELIRSIYGDPDDLKGGQLFDWLPDDCAPAWDLLAQCQQNKPTETKAAPTHS